MEHPRLQYLIEQYSNEQISDDELMELDRWFSSVDYGQKSFDDWVNEAMGEKVLVDDLYLRFREKLNVSKRTIYLKRIYWSLTVAASLGIIFFMGIVLISKQKPELITKNSSKYQIVPGSQKAILRLASGEQIVLDSQHQGKLANQYGITISKSGQARITYNVNANSATPASTQFYNTIETPKGGQYSIQLPDGTIAWLNAASTLKYPLSFAKNERRVFLTGEAYFEVVHHKNQPFKVISNNQEVTDLGTHFDVKAYSDDDAASTTLLEGSVKIHNLALNKSQLLVPGQQANLTHSNILVSVVNTQQVLSWKKGYFLFDNMDISNIMKEISRWYDVDVKYVDINQRETFGGTFSQHTDLKELLKNLQQLGHLHFQIDGRKIVVSK
jgi:transmembrane sensor